MLFKPNYKETEILKIPSQIKYLKDAPFIENIEFIKEETRNTINIWLKPRLIKFINYNKKSFYYKIPKFKISFILTKKGNFSRNGILFYQYKNDGENEELRKLNPYLFTNRTICWGNLEVVIKELCRKKDIIGIVAVANELIMVPHDTYKITFDRFFKIEKEQFLKNKKMLKYERRN